MKLTLWKDNQQVEAKPFGETQSFLHVLALTDRQSQKLVIQSSPGFSSSRRNQE